MTTPGGERLLTATTVLAEIAKHCDGLKVLSGGLTAEHTGTVAMAHVYTVRGAETLIGRLPGVFVHTLAEADRPHWSTREPVRYVDHTWTGTVLGHKVQILAGYNPLDGIGSARHGQPGHDGNPSNCEACHAEHFGAGPDPDDIPARVAAADALIAAELDGPLPMAPWGPPGYELPADIKPTQHCTSEGDDDCGFTHSHTAGWCGSPQPRRCGCAFCYPDAGESRG